ncbi:MAG: DUF547 domain-containing protein [Bacteroidota bacterium]
MKIQTIATLLLILGMSFIACQAPESKQPQNSTDNNPATEQVAVPTSNTTTELPTEVETTPAPEATPKTVDVGSIETPSAKAKKETRTPTVKEIETPLTKLEEPAPTEEKPSKEPPATAKPIEKPTAKPVSNDIPAEAKPAVPTKPLKPAFNHDAWDALTRKYVSSSGNVNYAGLRAEKANIENYLELLGANPPQSDWGRSKTIAFWINAYNAFTVKLILDNYPVKSILDLEGGKIWFTKKLKIGDKSYTLDHIEKKILIGGYKDARFHFAVNCAAKSCPKLLNKAFTSNNLESSLDKLTRAYINNTTFNKVSASKLELSQIFEWYAADFGDVKTFINKYTDTDVSGAPISYIAYDWNLNGN